MSTAQDPLDGFTNFYPIDPSNYRGGVYGWNSNGNYFPLNNETAYLKAYNLCPPLKSIVSKRAKAFNVGIIEVVNKNTLKKSQSTEANKVRERLKNPNILQTSRQFFAQQNIYIDIFGYCPVLKITPVGRPDVISAIWNIPPWLFDLKFGNNWLYATQMTDLFAEYTLNWKTGKINLNVNDVKIVFDDGFGTDYDMNLNIPDSRLVGQDYPVCNIIAAYKGRHTMLTRKGAIGILSNNTEDTVGHIPIPNGEKESIQKDFRRYGITGQEFQVIITDANLKWQQMGYPTKDLMMFEEIADDILSLCDAYNWPSELMGNQTGVTYLNREHAEKSNYTGTIIPESISRLEQLTEGLLGGESNDLIIRDYSLVPVLQEDKLLNARVRESKSRTAEKEFKNNVITLNDWLTLIGQPERSDGNGTKYYYELLDLGWQFGTTTSTMQEPQQETQTT